MRTPLLTQTRIRRRARLSDLERDVDAVVWDERRQAVRALLAKPLLVGAGNTRAFVNRHQEWLGLWFSHHVGWELDVDGDACRLMKRPADTLDDSRPCRDPASKDIPLTRRGYVFLSLVLSILVREGRQLTLKNIADQLGGIGKGERTFAEEGVPLELDRRETRRDLVQALRVLLDWRVLQRVDGTEDGYVVAEDTDVLYNINHPILSRILAARQPPSLVDADGADERMAQIWMGAVAGDSDDWRARQIGFVLFRRLLDDPVIYYRDLTEAERVYLDRQRPRILGEIERATGLVAEIRLEGIAMVDRNGDLSDFNLPETGTDGHLALLIATWMADRLRAGDADPIPIVAIEQETQRLAKIHTRWRKDARKDGGEVAITRETLVRLRALGLVTLVGDTVVPLPAIGRFGLREDAPTGVQSELF
ncbi:MAG: hypothetical protein ACI8XO_000430 [Verrucomicrobiales bacterium]|jgi:uncharacterized protein (TIGR02678 family)